MNQTPTDTAVRAEGLSKRFGEFTAVESFDLEVEVGTVVALLGPNGAGKTTTVRMLATLLRPDSGRAWVGGYDVVSQGARVRELIALTASSRPWTRTSPRGRTSSSWRGCAGAPRGPPGRSATSLSTASTPATSAIAWSRTCPAESAAGSISPPA